MVMWEKNLGITGINGQPGVGVYLNARDEGDFDVAGPAGSVTMWRPNSFLDMFKTGGGNNSGWGDARYDEIIGQLIYLSDPAERMPLLHEQEEILMRDMPIMPIYYYTNR